MSRVQPPFSAYRGSDPYVFVCYAHEDAELVYREISRLHEAGFNIWYDEGIEPGAEWSAEIAEHIENCSTFLYFVTPASVEREYCRREINFALDLRRTILHVHLKQTDVPPALKLNLNHRQAILRAEMSRKAYEAKLERALSAALAPTPEPGEVRPQARYTRRVPRIAAVLGVLGISILLTYFLVRDIETDTPDDCKPLTIAIMPFENLAGEGNQDQLAALLRADVWRLLAKVDGIGMISNASSDRLADPNLGLQPIGDMLGATYIVEGSYVGGESLARINVSLSEASTSLELWSDQFDVVIDSSQAAFEVTSSIATDIAKSLPTAISQQQLELFFEDLPTDSLEVWKLIMHATKQSQQTGDTAAVISTINKALELDPLSSQALATKAIYLGEGPLFDEAESLAKKAIGVDNNPTAHLALGKIYLNRDQNLPAAIESFQKALLHGANADLVGFMALEFFDKAGEWAAGLEAVERALKAGPGHPVALALKGRFLNRLGRFQEATAVYDRALEHHASNPFLIFDAFQHYLDAGELERAERTAGLATAPWPEYVYAKLAAQRGDSQPLLDRIEAWKSRDPAPIYLIGPAYYQLHLFDEHLKWMSYERIGDVQIHVSRQDPAYWDKLEGWSEGDTTRMDKLRQYREHLQTVESNLSFPIPPMDFVDEIFAKRFRCAGSGASYL